jgi:hypothetical protein
VNHALRSAAARCCIALGLSLAAAAGCGHTADERKPAPAQPHADDCSSPQLEEVLRSRPEAAVILVLHETNDAELAQRQERVLRDLGDGFRVVRRYAATAALAGQLTLTGLERARVQPDVRCIQLDGAGSGTPALP